MEFSGDEFNQWESYCDRLRVSADKICTDGIINRDKLPEEPRILFILRERRYKSPMEKDFRKALLCRPWKTLAIWAAGILEKKPNGDLPEYEEIYKKVESKGDLSRREYLEKVAVINLKKISGGPISNPPVINAYAYKCRKELLNQINAIKPTLIVAGATMDSLIWLLEVDIENIDEPWKHPVKAQGIKKDVWLIPMRHPSHDSKPKETYDKLRKVIKEIPN